MITPARAAKSLGYEFGARSFVLPNNYYACLSTTPIENDGTGFTEPVDTSGYVRALIPNTTEYWSEPSNYAVSNLQRISFNFTEGAGVAIATHWFISEHADSGEAGDVAIYYGELDVPRPMPAYSQIWVDIGDLKIERTNPS